MKKPQLPIIYTFPAIFEDSNGTYIAKFPDFPDCYSRGDDYLETFANAMEALNLQVYMMELKKKTIPTPTPIDRVGVSKKQVVATIELNMKLFRARMKGKFVKKTLNIPEYLNIMGEQRGVNFSAILREALIEKFKKEEE